METQSAAVIRSADFAKRLGIGVSTFRAWRKAGLIPPPLPLPGVPRWNRVVVEDFLRTFDAQQEAPR